MKMSRALNIVLASILSIVILRDIGLPQVLKESFQREVETTSQEVILSEVREASSENGESGVLLAPPRCAEDTGETEETSDEYEEEYTVEDYNTTMYANTDSNIRKGPSTNYEIIGGAKTNAEIHVTGRCSNGWLRIDYNGSEAYIAGRLVSSEPTSEPTPEPTPESTPEPTPEPTPETAPEPTPEATPEPTPEATPEPAPAPAPTRTPIPTNPAPSKAEQEYINAILAAVVRPEMSDREVAIALNNYLCAIAEYDHSYSRHSAMAIFTQGLGVCQSYANAYWRLMNAAGIPTDYISGQAFNGVQTGSHGWNRVLIDGAYYYVDVTWNDTCSNQYLLLSYEQISYDHFEQRINPYREY